MEVSIKRESTVINSVKVCHPSQGGQSHNIKMSCWKKTKNWDNKQRKLPFQMTLTLFFVLSDPFAFLNLQHGGIVVPHD